MAEATAQRATTSTTANPRARLLVWAVFVPILYMAFAVLAASLGGLVVIGARMAGYSPTATLLEVSDTEQQYLHALPAAHPVRWLAALPDRLVPFLLPSNSMAVLARMAPMPGRPNTGIDNALTIPASVRPYLADTLLVLIIAVRRGLAALGLLLPLSTIFAAAISDGLAQRELRKYGADPESGFVFRESRFAISTTIGASTLGYLLIPTALHPHFVLSLMAPVAGIAMAIAVTRYKKYL